MSKLSYHVNKFSEKVRHMNDTNSKEIVLTAAEARNLHTDIFALLAKLAELHDVKVEASDKVESAVMEGGKF